MHPADKVQECSYFLFKDDKEKISKYCQIKGALKHAHNPRRNITKEEAQALAELRKDHSRVILTDDKRVALVVMDRDVYNNKAQKLLEDRGTYKEIKTDSTNKLKNKLVSLLKKIKAEGGISDQLYKKMYPTGAVAPEFYGLPKIHKRDIPLKPIVSSRGSINYELAKELSRILRLLVGSSLHHIKNTGDFDQHLKGITLRANEDIVSYHVSALFTSVPKKPAINIIRRKLELDQELHLRTSISVVQIISLLEFCLKTIYFQFQGRFFEQLQGAAMGSPISLIVTNLYMEDYENKAINTVECLPKVWKRYMDDTFVVIEANKKQGFLHHINGVDPFIHFTTEDARTDGSIPFLDTTVMPQSDGSLLTSVYRKPMHTDQYLQWNSHHLSAKFSMIKTLKHRAKTVCSNQYLLRGRKPPQ